MTITALDLSLTATGLFHGDPTDPKAPCSRLEISTPSRRTGESDISWNARRYNLFSGTLITHLQEQRPDLLVIEITTHAHQMTVAVAYMSAASVISNRVTNRPEGNASRMWKRIA